MTLASDRFSLPLLVICTAIFACRSTLADERSFDVVIALDTSLTMPLGTGYRVNEPNIERKRDAAFAEVLRDIENFLRGIPEGARPTKITLVSFGRGARAFELKLDSRLREMLKADARYSDIYQGLKKSLQGLPKDRMQYVFLITDGDDNPSGRTDAERAANKLSQRVNELKPLVTDNVVLTYGHFGPVNAELERSIRALGGAAVPLKNMRFGLFYLPKDVSLSGLIPSDSAKWHSVPMTNVIAQNCDRTKAIFKLDPTLSQMFDFGVLPGTADFVTDDDLQSLANPQTSLTLRSGQNNFRFAFRLKNGKPGTFQGKIRVSTDNRTVIPIPHELDMRAQVGDPAIKVFPFAINNMATIVPDNEPRPSRTREIALTPNATAEKLLMLEGGALRGTLTIRAAYKTSPTRQQLASVPSSVVVGIRVGNQESILKRPGQPLGVNRALPFTLASVDKFELLIGTVKSNLSDVYNTSYVGEVTLAYPNANVGFLQGREDLPQAKITFGFGFSDKADRVVKISPASVNLAAIHAGAPGRAEITLEPNEYAKNLANEMGLPATARLVLGAIPSGVNITLNRQPPLNGECTAELSNLSAETLIDLEVTVDTDADIPADGTTLTGRISLTSRREVLFDPPEIPVNIDLRKAVFAVGPKEFKLDLPDPESGTRNRVLMVTPNDLARRNGQFDVRLRIDGRREDDGSVDPKPNEFIAGYLANLNDHLSFRLTRGRDAQPVMAGTADDPGSRISFTDLGAEEELKLEAGILPGDSTHKPPVAFTLIGALEFTSTNPAAAFTPAEIKVEFTLPAGDRWEWISKPPAILTNRTRGWPFEAYINLSDMTLSPHSNYYLQFKLPGQQKWERLTSATENVKLVERGNSIGLLIKSPSVIGLPPSAAEAASDQSQAEFEVGVIGQTKGLLDSPQKYPIDFLDHIVDVPELIWTGEGDARQEVRAEASKVQEIDLENNDIAYSLSVLPKTSFKSEARPVITHHMMFIRKPNDRSKDSGKDLEDLDDDQTFEVPPELIVKLGPLNVDTDDWRAVEVIDMGTGYDPIEDAVMLEPLPSKWFWPTWGEAYRIDVIDMVRYAGQDEQGAMEEWLGTTMLVRQPTLYPWSFQILAACLTVLGSVLAGGVILSASAASARAKRMDELREFLKELKVDDGNHVSRFDPYQKDKRVPQFSPGELKLKSPKMFRFFRKFSSRTVAWTSVYHGKQPQDPKNYVHFGVALGKREIDICCSKNANLDSKKLPAWQWVKLDDFIPEGEDVRRARTGVVDVELPLDSGATSSRGIDTRTAAKLTLRWKPVTSKNAKSSKQDDTGGSSPAPKTPSQAAAPPAQPDTTSSPPPAVAAESVSSGDAATSSNDEIDWGI